MAMALQQDTQEKEKCQGKNQATRTAQAGRSVHVA